MFSIYAGDTEVLTLPAIFQPAIISTAIASSIKYSDAFQLLAESPITMAPTATGELIYANQ